MRRWVALAPLLLVAGCLARVERAVIPVRDPTKALALSADILRREGFVIRTEEQGLVRTQWRYTEHMQGDAFLYYRYVVEQQEPKSETVGFRIEVIRCLYAPREGEDWDKSGCEKMPPRVPLWAEGDYRRIEKILRAILGKRVIVR